MVRKYFIKEIVIAILLIVGITISIKQYKNMAKEAVIQKVEESIKEVVKPPEDVKETIEEIKDKLTDVDSMKNFGTDGICDDVDDCIGVYDCNGICNGSDLLDNCGICNGDCDG